MKKFFYKIKNFLKTKEGTYFLLASLLGITMVFINPPFAGVPDEHAHYLKASAVASGYWRCTGKDQIPQSSFDLADKIKPVDVLGSEDQKVSLGKLKKEFFAQPNSLGKAVGNVVCGAPTTAYIPQAAGIFLVEKIGLSSLAGFYLARLTNLFFAIFFTFLAVRCLPFGKNILLVIALLPMTLQQYASLSYDALHISLSFLFLALVLELSFGERKVGKKELLWLGALAFFGLNVKGGFLLAGLALLIPKEKFKDAKAVWLIKSAIVAVGLAGFFFVRKIFFELGEASIDINSASQMKYVFHHPVLFLNSVFLTFYDKLGFFFETFLIKPGWLKVSLPYLFYVILFAGIVFLARNTDENKTNLGKIKISQRVWMFIIFLANFLLVFLALYLSWSKVGEEKVSGMQGRYFLSFSPLLFLTFYGAKINLRWEFLRKNNQLFFLGFFLFIFSWFFYFIFGYYYRTDVSSSGILNDQMATSAEIKNAEVLTFEKQVNQKFQQSKDNLVGIKIYFAKKVISAKYTFSIRDADCQKVLREKKFETKEREISNVEWKFALFEKEKATTEGGGLCFVLENLEGNFSDIKVFPPRKEKKANLTLDGNQVDKSLLFDLLYKN